MSASKLKSILIGLLGPSVDSADLDRLTTDHPQWVSDSAQVAAATDLVERCVFRAKRPCMVTGARLLCYGAIANDANDYQIWTAAKRTDDDPATNVDFLVYNTKTGEGGAVVAFTEKDMSAFFDATATKRVLAEGDAIWVKMTHANNGKNTPVTTIEFDVEELSD